MFTRLLLTCAFVLAWSDLATAQTYYFDDWTPRTFEAIPNFVDQAPPAGAPTVTVTVNYADTVAQVTPYVFGNNAVGWQGTSHTNTARMRHYGNANFSVLRFPGGSWSDEYFWNVKNEAGLPNDRGPAWSDNRIPGIASDDGWKLTPANFYTLIGALGTEAVITVNYGYARYGTGTDPVGAAAHMAAEWVRDANIRRGLGIKYWEVGNEVYGSWEAGNDVPGKGIVNGTDYGNDFRVFVDSMKAVDPTIKVGAVTLEAPSAWNNDYNRWNQRLFPLIADYADFLSVHVYFGTWDHPNPSPQNFFSALGWVDDIADYVRGQWETYANKPPIPLAMTEFNLQTTYGATDANQYFAVGQLNSLAFAVAFGKLIKNKYALATAWDLKNGWDGGRDHGLLSSSDEPGVAENTPHGSFFAYYYYTRLFGDVMVDARVSGASGIQVFASRFSSGETGIVLVNTSANDQVVRFDLQHINPGERYYWYEVQDDDANARKITINGITGTQAGGGPDRYEDVAAFSSPVTGEVVVASKKYSVNYVLVEAAPGRPVAVEAREPAVALSAALYPNPARDHTTLHYTVDRAQEVGIELYDVTGRLVRSIPATRVPTGTHEAVVGLEGLAGGLYLCAVRFASGGTVIRKLAVLK